MMEDPVAALPEAEYRRVWDRFYAEFNFQPSMSSLKWPAIQEPVASVTWSLATLPDEPDYERLDRLVEVVELGLASCVGPQDTLFALDWQHTSYRFAPQGVGGPGQPAWPLSPYPDGDYFIFLSEDFHFGSFGHPWEESICLFGEELLDAASADVDEVLGPPIRRSGKAVGRV
ncbi:DUF2716 domain-containing protein [Streptomyces beijiangensis]|uniref:DUF2716 domain-containing protein n=1 Tax=Streptomyces beijiangensis TaxID=163361 RepID=A0A939JH78_9ACTN|nr:DUF2716 domain-containing protein [Streptomyces beijiangensis]MBO0514188.1 DUF2716 domain-containing protein [Streptomyces beijiangensis]